MNVYIGLKLPPTKLGFGVYMSIGTVRGVITRMQKLPAYKGLYLCPVVITPERRPTT